MSADARFVKFIAACRGVLAVSGDESRQLKDLQAHLKPLLGASGWLPASHSAPRADRYAQYLLYAAPDDSFSVVSFVWQPGQWTPIHDHTVWGVIGIHQGIERTELWARGEEVALACTRTIDSGVGEIGAVSPTVGDIHRVGNVSDGTAISIHLYGGNIGRINRHTYDVDGTSTSFVSGYEPPAAILVD